MTATPLGMRAYARHRQELGLPGQSHAAVRKAIERGSLVQSVKLDTKGRPKIDAALADKEWRAGTDPVQQREPDQARGRFSGGNDAAEQGALFPELRTEPEPAGAGGVDQKPGPSIRKAQAVRVTYQAQMAKLEYDERSGKLCNAAAVSAEAFRLARLVRDGVLNVADRLCSQLAAETDQHQCRDLLIRELVEAMQELAEKHGQETAG